MGEFIAFDFREGGIYVFGMSRSCAVWCVASALGVVACFSDEASNAGESPAPDGGGDVTIDMTQITVGELVFDARVAGPPEGELVLLLHGFPQTSLQWKEQLLALGRAGYRAVAPDQRGYSPGARPPDVESYGIVTIVGDAIGMANELGYDTFHVVGHDWGGGVAWGIAGVVPDRVTTLTVLSTPHPGALSTSLEDPDSCQYQASAYFEVLSAPDAGLAELAQIGIGFEGIPEDALQEYTEKVFTQPETLDAALNWYRANVSDRTLDAPATNITVPTLYMWGTADVTFCRETAEDTANYVSGPYRFVAIEGAGHWLPEEEAAMVNEALLAHVGR